jgi:hypothetical protein
VVDEVEVGVRVGGLRMISGGGGGSGVVESGISRPFPATAVPTIWLLPESTHASWPHTWAFPSSSDAAPGASSNAVQRTSKR